MTKKHSQAQMGMWAEENRMKKWYDIWPSNIKKHKENERRKHFAKQRQRREERQGYYRER